MVLICRHTPWRRLQSRSTATHNISTLHVDPSTTGGVGGGDNMPKGPGCHP